MWRIAHRLWARWMDATAERLLCRVLLDVARIERADERLNTVASPHSDDLALLRQSMLETFGGLSRKQRAEAVDRAVAALRDARGNLSASLRAELAKVRETDRAHAASLVGLAHATEATAKALRARVHDLTNADQPARAAIRSAISELATIADGVRAGAEAITDIAEPYRPARS